jgi:hypothetical protein
MMDFTNLTDEELEQAREIVNAEITKRYMKEKEEHKEELIKLLNRVNELQDKYCFEISCDDDDNGCWASSASNFKLEN